MYPWEIKAINTLGISTKKTKNNGKSSNITGNISDNYSQRILAYNTGTILKTMALYHPYLLGILVKDTCIE